MLLRAQYVTLFTICYFVFNSYITFLTALANQKVIYYMYEYGYLLYYRVIIFKSPNALNCRVAVKESSMNNLILHEMLIENI